MFKVMGISAMKGSNVKGKTIGEFENRADAFRALGALLDEDGTRGYVCYLVSDDEGETWTILPNSEDE
jgi:hypothetical protein